MDVDRTVQTRRTGGWSAAIVPIGVALMLLGAWAFFAPLVGPYFDYGFDTDTAWLFSTQQWELSLGPGIAVFVGGLLMLVPAVGPAWLAGLLATVGGMWLLVGPSVYPLWASDIAPDGSSDMQTLKWIGYFYGTGALIVYLAAYAHGLLTRRTYVEERAPVVSDDTVTEHRRAA
jgi:hypothetical protein